MRIQVLTIFPELFAPFLDASLIGRARRNGLLEVEVLDLRAFTTDAHKSVDDEPYGGGGGMVMTAEPWLRALDAIGGARDGADRARRILLSPQAPPLDDARVRSLAEYDDLILLCGRYEGIDERVRTSKVDEEVSIGDYVLSGGELPAMVLIEAVSRQIPGIVGLASSVENDSHRNGLLDHPHYTRPREVAGLDVPDVLLSGDHARIDSWRREQSLAATATKRPDLLATCDLTPADRRYLSAMVASDELQIDLETIVRQGVATPRTDSDNRDSVGHHREGSSDESAFEC